MSPEPALDTGDNAGDDTGLDWIFGLIDQVTTAIMEALRGNPRQVTGSPELITEIRSVLDDEEIRQDYPGYAYDTRESDDGFVTLRLYLADQPPGIPVPSPERIYVPPDLKRRQPKRAKKPAYTTCDFCEGSLLLPERTFTGFPVVLSDLRCGFCASSTPRRKPEPGLTCDRTLYQGGYGVTGIERPAYLRMLAELARPVVSVIAEGSRGGPAD